MEVNDLHVHVHVETPELSAVIAQLTRMEEKMSQANDALNALKAQISDTTADVLAKIDQLKAQVGTLDTDAQATLDQIQAGVKSLDDAVGDADGSDTPPVV